MIAEDISTTLPTLNIFYKETGPLYGDLKDMLCAWVVSRSDEGLDYAFGAARIAAMLLLNMPSQEGFIVMRNLLERHCLRSFFGGEHTKEDVSICVKLLYRRVQYSRLSSLIRKMHIAGDDDSYHKFSCMIVDYL